MKTNNIGNGKILLNKLSDMSPSSKASIAMVLAKFVQKGIAMISAPVFTRIMPIDQYGLVSTFTSWQNILFIIFTLNLSSGVFNNGMLDFKKDRDSFSFSVLCLANALTVIWAIVYLIFYNWLSPILEMPDYLMIIMFAYCLFFPAYGFWMARERFEFRYKAVTIVTILLALISNVAAVIVVMILPDDVKGVGKLVTTELATAAVGLFFVVYLFIKAKGKCNFKYWKYAFVFNFPLLPHYLSIYALSSSDRIMITKLVGSSPTAIYNVAYTVASILLIFWDSIDASYAPWIYQKLEEKSYESINLRGKQILLLFAGTTIFSTLFAPEIIRVLAPSSYYSGIYVIPSVAAGVFFTALYSLYMRVELYAKQTKKVTVATFCAALINIVLNYIFIPIFGFYAAGYTTLVSYIFLAVFHYFNVKKIGYGFVYNVKPLLLISAGVLVSIVFISAIYEYAIIRYALIVAILLVGILKRKDIIKLIKKPM